VTDVYDLNEHETVLLVEAVRTVDLLAALDAAVRADGALVDSPQGLRAHPAAVEAGNSGSPWPGCWPLCGSLPVARVTGRPMPARPASSACAACTDSVQAHREAPGA